MAQYNNSFNVKIISSGIYMCGWRVEKIFEGSYSINSETQRYSKTQSIVNQAFYLGTRKNKTH